MSQGDWVTVVSVAFAIVPAVTALVWLVWIQYKTDGKGEV